ncbi:MAG: hypothetical protein KUG78_15000 [Kangiellaceae bacterium]|nr:hypothetical protein [Kangiellaceae bacterium]
MAFDMFLGKERACIDHHEEGLFAVINDDDSYPKLNWIWQEYYDSPLIQPNDANELVHELLALRLQVLRKDELKYLTSVIDRLLPFLSNAYRENEQIKCGSD